MTIAVGSKIPSVKIKQVTEAGTTEIDTAELFAGKKVVMFSLPGAFTPTCSGKHLPGFVANAEEFRKKGVDLVVCLSVNDAFVMKAWGEAHGALGKIVMLADGEGKFSQALGINVTIPGMGLRAGRGAVHSKDGVVTAIELEAPGQFEVSGAEACLLR